MNHGSGSPISTSQISLSGDEKIEAVEIEYSSHVSSSVVGKYRLCFKDFLSCVRGNGPIFHII